MVTQGYVKLKFLYWNEVENAEHIESMWVTKEGINYKIDNIPFYVLDFALDDVVSAKEVNGELYVDSLISESGHSTIRVIFFNKTIIHQTRAELKLLGCDSEVSDRPDLIAIDIPPEVNYINIVKPYLNKGCLLDLWDYEEACLASIQRREND